MRLPPQIGVVECALVGERKPPFVGQYFAANVVEPSTDQRDDVIVVIPRLGSGEHQREKLVQPAHTRRGCAPNATSEGS